MTSFVQKILVGSNRHKSVMAQNVQKRCCRQCIFEMTGSLLLQWHARVYEETLNVNFKIVETMQYILNLACEHAPCSQGTSI